MHFHLSFLTTWPYNLCRYFPRTVVIGSMLASLQISSFLMWSFLVMFSLHLTLYFRLHVLNVCLTSDVFSGMFTTSALALISSVLIFSVLFIPIVHFTLIISGLSSSFCSDLAKPNRSVLTLVDSPSYTSSTNHTICSRAHSSLEWIPKCDVSRHMVATFFQINDCTTQLVVLFTFSLIVVSM